MIELVEIPILALLGAGGIGVFVLFGERRLGIIAGGALIGGVSILLLVFPVSFLTGINPLFPGLFGAASLSGAALFRRENRPIFIRALALYFFLVVSAWILRFVVQVRERPGEDAISVMLQAVLELQQGSGPSDIRRSFAYPLLIATAPEGTILASATPLLLISVVVLAITTGRSLLPTSPSFPAQTSVMIGTVIVVSAPIFWVALAYTNAHVLVALAIAVAAHAVLQTTKTLALSRSDVGLLALSAFVVSTSRFEGGLLFLLTLTPILLGTGGYLRSSRVIISSVSLIPALGLGYWLSVADGMSPVNPSIYLMVLIGIPVGLVALCQVLPIRAERWLLLAGWIVLVLLVLVLPVAMYGWVGARSVAVAQFRNLLLGVSGWGAVIAATIVASLWLFRSNRSRLYRAATRIWSWGVLATIVLKLLDSRPGNEGFNNTLSRTFLHWLGPLIILWSLGLYETLRSRSGRRKRQAPREEQDSRFQ